MSDDVTFSDLRPGDHRGLAAKRVWVISQNADPEKFTTAEARLSLPDIILQSNIGAADETIKLQPLGVVLGDAIAAELKSEWRVYEDEYCRDPAPIMPGGKLQSFSRTMISKCATDEEEIDVIKLFATACAHSKMMLKEAHQEAS